MAFDAYLPPPRGILEGIGGAIGEIGKVLTSPEVAKAATTYLNYLGQRDASKAQQKAADQARRVSNAYAGAQVQLLAKAPELALLGPGAFSGYDPGGYLNAYYRGTTSPVYTAPGSAPAAGPVQAAAAPGSDDSLLIVLGLGALLAVMS